MGAFDDAVKDAVPDRAACGDLATLRGAAAKAIAALPPEIRALAPAQRPYPDAISPRLQSEIEALRALLTHRAAPACRAAK